MLEPAGQETGRSWAKPAISDIRKILEPYGLEPAESGHHVVVRVRVTPERIDMLVKDRGTFVIERVKDGYVLTRRHTLEDAIAYAAGHKRQCRVTTVEGQRLWQDGQTFEPDPDWLSDWTV